ncbi:MAG: fructosamine kinase family protein [Salibacter sp.]|uniref:fructosamine kinase family protein n=1 Tax=Salibacter sp. TaxID=2010995 RepID=UPI002870B304|nr:fructosamine kinase family protein [Salibacter sp.]MDR9399599.1 fructosamine kinase family protein [Salibacter sp.]
MVSEQEIKLLYEKLQNHGQIQNPITSSQSVSGGSINDAYKLESDDQNFFLKVNSASRFPCMFEAEAKGLSLLSEHSEFAVPKPILNFEENDRAYLVLEWLDEAPGSDQEETGRLLAKMHQSSTDQFGLDFDNYMGSLEQSNTQYSEWAPFFIEQRLEPQLKMARDNGDMQSEHSRQFEKLYYKLEELFPPAKPSLVHGDLWGGNAMNTSEGPSIYDPAVYYGHPEVDIAMTTLFGGFDRSFYQAYMKENPLEKEWRGRLPLYNLYPLLVHVNLFGSGYLMQVESILKKFV